MAKCKTLDACVRRWLDSPDSDRAAKLIAMAHLCLSIGIAYHEEADDILRRYNLVYQDLKFRTNNLQKAFDAYDRSVVKILDEEAVRLMCHDFDTLRGMLDRYMDEKASIKQTNA